MKNKIVPPHKLLLVSKKVYDKRKKNAEFNDYSDKEFIALVNEQRQRIEKLEIEIALLKEDKTEVEHISKYNLIDYNQAWSYTNKICFVLRCKNKPMDSLEIYTILMDIDERFRSVQRPQTTLSSVMTPMWKSQCIIKYKRPRKKNLLFLMPNWISKNGEPLAYYNKYIMDRL